MWDAGLRAIVLLFFFWGGGFFWNGLVGWRGGVFEGGMMGACLFVCLRSWVGLSRVNEESGVMRVGLAAY